MGPGAIETLDGAHWQQFEKIAPAIRSMQSTAMTQDQAGVLSRSRQKFRHPFRRATGKPRDALDQVSVITQFDGLMIEFDDGVRSHHRT